MSRAGVKRAALAFAVESTDHAVAVFISIHLDDVLARLVVDIDHATGVEVATVKCRRQTHQVFAVGLVGRDRATPKRRGQADAQAA